MKTKSMKKPKKLSNKPSKKLSARARRKELTGINLRPIQERLEILEADSAALEAVVEMLVNRFYKFIKETKK